MNIEHYSMRLLCAVIILLYGNNVLAITGGQDTASGEAPWTAALVDTSIPVEDECLESGGSEDFCQQYCAGTVVAGEWVLTAAHCLVERNVERDVRVVLGSPDLNDDARQRHEVHEPVLHDSAPDNRDEVTFENDIGLLRLKSATGVQPASLAQAALLNDLESNADTLNDPVTIYGWGRLHDNGAFPAHLQQVAFDLRPLSLYPDCDNNPFFDEDTMVCVSETEAETIEPNDSRDNTPRDPYGEGSCEKDSGGPMVSRRNGKPFVTGVASWGLSGNCGDPEAPDVYTRVPAFLDFIEQKTLDSAGTTLINPVMEIDAVNSTDSTSTGVTVTLRNDSVQNAVPDPEFTLSWEGSGDVLHDTSGSGLSCSRGTQANTFVCQHDTDMNAGSQANATFTAANLQQDATLKLQADAAWSSGGDYQGATGTATHRISRTSKPNLRLALDGAVPERLQNGGQLHLFVTVSNASSHVDAEGVKLKMHLPSDHTLTENTAGLGCNTGISPVECNLTTTLEAGSSTTLGPIRLSSPGARDGDLELSVTANNGDFPTSNVNEDPDSELTHSITYPAAPPSTANPDNGTLSGGHASGWLFFILILSGIRTAAGMRRT